jgi:hypothetical protein
MGLEFFMGGLEGMETIECSSCKEQVNLPTWRVLVGGPVKCSSCGVYVNQHDGQPYFQKDGTTTSPSAVTSAPSRTTHASTPTDYEALSSLPTIYYVLAIFCGVVLIGFTIANSDELSSTEIGAWVGYTVGGVLSMFAVGRVIELLQQIRDAVRNTPALSPSRPDAK